MSNQDAIHPIASFIDLAQNSFHLNALLPCTLKSLCLLGQQEACLDTLKNNIDIRRSKFLGFLKSIELVNHHGSGLEELLNLGRIHHFGRPREFRHFDRCLDFGEVLFLLQSLGSRKLDAKHFGLLLQDLKLGLAFLNLLRQIAKRLLHDDARTLNGFLVRLF